MKPNLKMNITVKERKVVKVLTKPLMLYAFKSKNKSLVYWIADHLYKFKIDNSAWKPVIVSKRFDLRFKGDDQI